jgi:hypothetical protein
MVEYYVLGVLNGSTAPGPKEVFDKKSYLERVSGRPGEEWLIG